MFCCIGCCAAKKQSHQMPTWNYFYLLDNRQLQRCNSFAAAILSHVDDKLQGLRLQLAKPSVTALRKA